MMIIRATSGTMRTFKVWFHVGDSFGTARLVILGSVRRLSLGADKRGVVDDHHPFYFLRRNVNTSFLYRFPTDGANCTGENPYNRVMAPQLRISTLG